MKFLISLWAIVLIAAALTIGLASLMPGTYLFLLPVTMIATLLLHRKHRR